MNSFDYIQAGGEEAALAQIGPGPGSTTAAGFGKFIAGGTNLIDLMKENVMRPAWLVDINALHLHDIESMEDGGLRLGALAHNANTAYHPLVRSQYPLLTAAILAGASPQIRNMASNGGNLLQRTRCYYFYDAGVPCNKRQPGSGCPAIGGLARQHAILGASQHCIATHPSDMCVALRALDAVVQVRSARGSRHIPFADFHRLPGDRPDIDTTLAHDELITHIMLPPAGRFAGHSVYIKLRDRASYAFALVSVAAALDLDDRGLVKSVRIALGGVAHKPWRDEVVEAQMIGLPAGTAAFDAAARALLERAESYGTGPGSNAFKLVMARRAVVRALEIAARGTVSNTSAEERMDLSDMDSAGDGDIDDDGSPEGGEEAMP